jgi:polar amino acid transport system substrate-binding protein
MRLACLLFIAVAALFALPAAAQTMPHHADPSARELLRDFGPVPAIRFLTTADFPPFNYRDPSGELVGFNIDLARRICAEVEVPCTIQAWPWEQVTDALAENQGDALIAGLALTPQNAEQFDFSSIYLVLPGRFVTRRDAVEGFTPDTLAGREVAVRDGSSHEAFLRRYLPEIAIMPAEDEIAALEAVKSGEAAAYFGDAMRASFWLNRNLDCCAFAGEAYYRPQLFGEGLAVAVPAGRDAVRSAIDWALVRLMENGSLDELYLRWFPIGFY